MCVYPSHTHTHAPRAARTHSQTHSLYVYIYNAHNILLGCKYSSMPVTVQAVFTIAHIILMNKIHYNLERPKCWSKLTEGIM